MLVVADTGPPHYLVLSGNIGLLPRLFGRLTLPDVVHDELCHAHTPEAVRRWAASAPDWLDIAATSPQALLIAGLQIDAGERAAIAAALDRKAALVLMDDRRGVAAAEAAGLRVTGTLGVLDRAGRRGLVDFTAAIARLRATNFHCRPDLFDALLARHRRPGGN